jgi:hypothetical protein
MLKYVASPMFLRFLFLPEEIKVTEKRASMIGGCDKN